MKRGLVAGALAGSVGTLVLDVVSYKDMFLRGRPASELPGQAAARVAGLVGVRLDGDDDRSRSRRSALGALLGYGTGVAVGAAYGLVARGCRGGVMAGLALGGAVMVVSNGPMVAFGLTDPRTWGVTGWISDIVPHVAYGVATVTTYRAITS